MIVDITSVLSGLTLDRIEIKWILDKNPLFDDARDAPPAGTTVIPGGSERGWDQWAGSAPGDTAKVVGGTVIQGRFFFDLPDENFAHPGDVVRYYIEAEDSGGNISTLPADIDGFATGRDANHKLYPSNFTLHMLPSVVDDTHGGLAQPWVLVWNDFGFRGGINDYYQAIEQNAWRRGIEWDMYTTWGPTSLVSNGLGSAGAHGATPEQLGGYGAIVYFAGDLGEGTMSDGSDQGGNDKGDDLGTMQGWFNADADRYVAHFGDDLVEALLTDAPGAGGTYVSTVMGVSLGDGDVRDEIEGQTAPVVIPADPNDRCFRESFFAFGGCPGPNDFDSIDATPPAIRTHEFTQPGGIVPYGPPFGPLRLPTRSWTATATRRRRSRFRTTSCPYGTSRAACAGGRPPAADRDHSVELC